MAAFSEDDDDRLDWELLKYGAVTLYCRRELFDRDIDWLRNDGYGVHFIDCSDASTFTAQMTRALRFKENYGYEPWGGSLDALTDAFRHLDFTCVVGIAFCFFRLDILAAANRRLVQRLLDIIETESRDSLLLGHRLLALGQSANPNLRFDLIGARSVTWNRQEWLDADRLS